MLALFHNHSQDELHLPSGQTVRIPRLAGAPDAGSAELDTALRYAFKSGLISHADFLAGRDLLMDDVEVVD